MSIKSRLAKLERTARPGPEPPSTIALAPEPPSTIALAIVDYSAPEPYPVRRVPAEAIGPADFLHGRRVDYRAGLFEL